LHQSRPTKVAIVGVGLVGSTYAYSLLLSAWPRRFVLIRRQPGAAEGEAMDLNHAVPFAHPTKICAGEYSTRKAPPFTVIAAGASQKPGETRLDLVKRNAAIFGQVVPRVAGGEPGRDHRSSPPTRWTPSRTSPSSWPGCRRTASSARARSWTRPASATC